MDTTPSSAQIDYEAITPEIALLPESPKGFLNSIKEGIAGTRLGRVLAVLLATSGPVGMALPQLSQAGCERPFCDELDPKLVSIEEIKITNNDVATKEDAVNQVPGVSQEKTDTLQVKFSVSGLREQLKTTRGSDCLKKGELLKIFVFGRFLRRGGTAFTTISLDVNGTTNGAALTNDGTEYKGAGTLPQDRVGLVDVWIEVRRADGQVLLATEPEEAGGTG